MNWTKVIMFSFFKREKYHDDDVMLLGRGKVCPGVK
jgi:hypothetical protein